MECTLLRVVYSILFVVGLCTDVSSLHDEALQSCLLSLTSWVAFLKSIVCIAPSRFFLFWYGKPANLFTLAGLILDSNTSRHSHALLNSSLDLALSNLTWKSKRCCGRLCRLFWRGTSTATSSWSRRYGTLFARFCGTVYYLYATYCPIVIYVILFGFFFSFWKSGLLHIMSGL